MEFDDFRKQVKGALEHLHDAAHLETRAAQLLPLFADATGTTRATRAQRLRVWLKDAIEQLRPQSDLPASSPEWRSYLALRYRYVQGMSQGEIESELGISLRQLQRELHEGLDALATLLWEQRTEPTSAPPHQANAVQELEAELSQWNLTRQNYAVHTLVTETLATLKPVWESRRIVVNLDVPTDIQVFVDATLTRQALLHVLRLVAQKTTTPITLRATAQDKQAVITITWRGDALDHAEESWRKADLLCRQQGGTLTHHAERVRFELPRTTQARVLVIDDNPALQQLFERYLAPLQYQVFHAQNGTDALRLAREAHPDIITLDVMMPNVDGWQVLRALAQNPATAKIPVVICSVLPEPELALSLGARAYLKKPVERLTLIETLARIRQAPADAAPMPPLLPASH